ncbi:hypothetical protein RND61_10130 [Streptomyces sp. TRM76323]|uniref:WYL domain-containing protein n=1 Tax=Streptomyces tamarix TaxID=3078565 RepID=A0ABU3QI42_9ACTN|nr:hypothetical protein [Streptomyces tamarix]MDT9682422.1 hypothetical protein [Streptomyces tamarix]
MPPPKGVVEGGSGPSASTTSTKAVGVAYAHGDLPERDIGYGDHLRLPFTDDTEQRDLLTTWIICSYDTRVLPRDVVVDARRTHPELAVRRKAETPIVLTDGGPEPANEQRVPTASAGVGTGRRSSSGPAGRS